MSAPRLLATAAFAAVLSLGAAGVASAADDPYGPEWDPATPGAEWQPATPGPEFDPATPGPEWQPGADPGAFDVNDILDPVGAWLFGR